MKNRLVTMLFFVLCCAVWPGNVQAEILRPAAKNQELMTFKKRSNLPWAGKDTAAKSHTAYKRRGIQAGQLNLQKWKGEGGERGWLIVAVVLLSMLAFTLTMYGGFGLVVFVIVAAFGGGGEGGILLLCFGLLLLAALCMFGIGKIAKKLRRLKQEKTPQEELPRRPPSRKMENQ